LTADFEQLVRNIVREEIAKMTKPAEYLSVRAAAELASVTMSTIRRWVREKRLVEHRAGREVRVKRTDLERLMSVGRRRAADAHLSPEARALRDVG
jgi:excisionase family DNA binding protein